jgi:hypothetical protein
MNAVQVVKVNRVRPQLAQALFDLPAQDVRLAFAGRVAAFGGRDQAWPIPVGQRCANRALAVAADVQVGRVDDVDAGLHGSPDEGDMAWRVAQPVRAKPDARHLRAAQADRPHWLQSAVLGWPACQVESRNPLTSVAGSAARRTSS